MYFNNKQLKGLTNIVDLFHVKFILENAGVDALTTVERKMLQTSGINLAEYKNKRTPVEESYLFGRAQSSVRNNKTFNRLDLKQFRQFMAENPELFKLTAADRDAVKLAKQAFANDIRRLAGDIKADYQQKLIEVSKVVTPTTSKKKILSTIAGALATNTKKYSSRFELISSYRCHETFQDGIAHEIFDRLGPNAKVYFSVHKDACLVCKKLFLKKNGEPKIFLLSTLIKNGSNIGRPNNKKLPSIGPVHPRCRCKLNMIPKGKVKFSTKQNMYIRVFS